ncbi:MAG TPA: DUF2231 domain-containing protein [Terriglobales bacterium]|nr:DUF2231 domain-containing protein [Terriglobales bacterium]
MHPFDLKQALLAKHAQHVVIIHFPIALFVVGVAFDLAAHFSARTILRSVAYYNFVVAAVSAPLAVATGILAWQLQLNGQRLHGIILMHLLLGSASAALILFTWFIHRSALQRQTPLPHYRFPVEVLAVGVVALTAHLGGFLSGVNVVV